MTEYESKREDEDLPKTEEEATIRDLDVPESEGGDVKGGRAKGDHFKEAEL
jgi:hypothetical protein